MQTLGIDVSKNDLHAVLLLDDGKAKRHAFANNPRGFEQILKWLQNCGVDRVHACMESTGGWGEDLAEELYQGGHIVSIANPALIKAFGQSEGLRTKTDDVDAALIARYCERQQPKPWSPPTQAEKVLQALVRRRQNLLDMRTQEENRAQAPRTAGAVKQSLETHLSYLDNCITDIEREIKKHVDGDPDLRTKRDLLTTIPGIADITAYAILAEMPGLAEFANVKAVGGFAGLSPKHHQSGLWAGRSRICKTGNPNLRKALYWPAVTAIRINPLLAPFAQRLTARGKCKMVVITATMRKLLTIAYGVLKSGRPFDAQVAT